MSLVGKIFTMLILIFSIVFMAFSMMVFATHKNWKASAQTLQASLAAAERVMDALNIPIPPDCKKPLPGI